MSLAAVILVGLSLAACAADPAADAPAATVEEATDAAPESPSTEVAVADSYSFTDASTISFVGSKVTGSHDGGFRTFQASMELPGDDFTAAAVHVEIQTDSLWSDSERLTGHLKSPDFFDVESFPTATFHSTGITTNDDGTYTVTGNLDLHGVTKQISFPATIQKAEAGGYAVSAEFSIKRFDFGIAFAGAADDLIRDDVLIKLDLTTSA